MQLYKHNKLPQLWFVNFINNKFEKLWKVNWNINTEDFGTL